MQFTDSHLHLQDYKTKDAQQIIASLRSLGFVKVVCASTSPQDWQAVADFACLAPDLVVPAFGLHPWYLDLSGIDFAAKLEACLRRFPSAWVGECGLDKLKGGDFNSQEHFFNIQISIAKAFHRPLNIHALKVEDVMARLLPQMPPQFMLHSFSGSNEFLRLVLKKGGYISISKALLKRKNSREIITMLPTDRILLESDGPFLSDYSDIPSLAQTIAELKGLDYAAFVAQVKHNLEDFCHG